MTVAREDFAAVEGGRVYYEVSGEGPAIVLLHAGLWDRARIPGARRETIAGADHVLHMRRPEEFNRLVLSFLDGQ